MFISMVKKYLMECITLVWHMPESTSTILASRYFTRLNCAAFKYLMAWLPFSVNIIPQNVTVLNLNHVILINLTNAKPELPLRVRELAL